MVIGKGYDDGVVTEEQARALLAQALEPLRLQGKRVLVIIPDGTRTAPVPLFFRLFDEALGPQVRTLDYLVALGTHPLMSDERLLAHVGLTPQEKAERYPTVGLFNHHWEQPETFRLAGVISAAETRALSQGLMDEEIPVALNRLVWEYDQLIICGPTFPHEVVGFSGGLKYLFPGIASQEIIDATHWLGALLTNMAINGVAHTPVREVLNRAARLVPAPVFCCSLVMRGRDLAGLFLGPPEEAFEQAAALSARLNVVYLERPFETVLSIPPTMYDDLWTAAKAMYKLEPIVADGGEVVIYAPHISEVSYTHGAIIDQIGYHSRDYFLGQWERFKGAPRAVLAHSTHLAGLGVYEDGVDRPRIRVTLATGIPRARCQRINVGYADSARIEPTQWKHQEGQGILVVENAGEVLYRLRQ
ncbi:MAG: DUF2088 domain-containing protein [Chloroflexi bacterium]|nr:DUF2088 domain-containing protein [Chloroflexota bacterium]